MSTSAQDSAAAEEAPEDAHEGMPLPRLEHEPEQLADAHAAYRAEFEEAETQDRELRENERHEHERRDREQREYDDEEAEL